MTLTYAGRYDPEAFVDPYGQPLRNTTVTVYEAGTTTLATLYESRTKSSSIPNPTATDARGNCSFYAAPGYYDLLINGVTIQNVSVEVDPADVESRADGNEVIARSVLTDKGSILIASGPESPASFDPNGAVDGEALVVSSASPTGWTTQLITSEAGPHTHPESEVTDLDSDLADLATTDAALAAADAAHASDTTSVHGISDTSELITDGNLATGTPDGTKYLRDDRSWQPVAGGGTTIAQQTTAPSSPSVNDLWIDTDAVPPNVSMWDQIVNLPGTTIAGWTVNGGTWAANAGGYIEQTGTAASYSGLFLDADAYIGSGLVFQAEIRLPTAGQPGGTPRRAMLSMASTTSTSGVHSPWGGIQKGADGIVIQRGDQAAVGPVSATINYDTWYTVRTELMGSILTVSLDGTRLFSERLGQAAADVLAEQVGLITYQAIAHYRNIKAWRLAAPT